MPIQIIRGQPIPSSAARHLLQELRNYRDSSRDQSDRLIRGRSFLIAGHRGAGKTSMLSYALDSLKDEGLQPLIRDPRRFLYVPIHGPSLLTGYKTGAEAPAQNGKPPVAGDPGAAPQDAGAADAKDKKAAEYTGDPVLLAALEQIVLSLYRSLVDEITLRYRERALERSAKRGGAELRERAAQLQLELDEYPGPERLRDFWAAGDFLQSGVLFPPSVHHNLPLDQGFRELVALSSACEAFRVVSGTFEKVKQEMKEAAEQERKSERGTDTTGKDLISPLISLATGGLVGVGVSGHGPLLAVVAGLATAIGTSTVFKFSTTRSAKRSYNREYTFIPRRDVATLDRALPTLVGRVQAAGLLPIFAVDELDKVDGLPKLMGPIVGQLKKFVSEQSFFCFLTNRDYYEYLQARSLNETYPIEHTYFTDRLFVVFRSDDFHQYLERTLVVPEPAPSSQAPATGSSAPAPSTPARPAATRQGTDEHAVAVSDREVLPYVLLHRAEMHATDMRRQVDEIRAPGDLVALDPGLIRTRLGDRLDLMIQLAMRIMLDRRELRNATEREPAYLRLAYDALFYPCRLRRGGELDLDLSETETVKNRFRDDMLGRMASEQERKLGVEGLTLDRNDLDFLFARVQELAELLADPFAFCDAMDTWERDADRRLSPAVRDALPFVLSTGPLLQGNRDGSCKYRWGYDHLGRDVSQLRRTAFAYQLDVEYELAVRMVLSKATKDPQVRRLLRAALWIPYKYWRDQPALPVTLHTLTGNSFKQALAQALPSSTCEALSLVFPKGEDIQKPIGELLQTLVDTGTFRDRLVTEEWTAAYPLITRQLRPHSPMLGPTYIWEFDFQGVPRTGTAEGPASPETTTWEKQIQFIRTAETALARLTKGTLTFATLGTDANIIPVSPVWTAVQAAIDRLRQSDRFNKGATEMNPDDLATVEQFAILLSRQGETIALAVVCAAIVGRAAQLPDSESISRGLSGIAATLGVASGERRPPLELLKSLASEAMARWSDLPEDLLSPPALEPDRPREWEDWIEARVQSAEHKVDPALMEAVRRAWSDASPRLRSWLKLPLAAS